MYCRYTWIPIDVLFRFDILPEVYPYNNSIKTEVLHVHAKLDLRNYYLRLYRNIPISSFKKTIRCIIVRDLYLIITTQFIETLKCENSIKTHVLYRCKFQSVHDSPSVCLSPAVSVGSLGIAVVSLASASIFAAYGSLLARVVLRSYSVLKAKASHSEATRDAGMRM